MTATVILGLCQIPTRRHPENVLVRITQPLSEQCMQE